MVLEYLWIEKFKNIENKGVSFSNRFNIYVTLSADKNVFFLKVEDLPEKMPIDFFGDKISNISVIAGKNGSGKSSLLNLIHGELPWNGNHLHIYYDDKNNTLYYVASAEVLIENSSTSKIKRLFLNDSHQIPSITKSRLVMEARQASKLIKCNLDYSPVFSEMTFDDHLGEFIDYIFYDEENKVIKTEGFKNANSLMISQVLELLFSYNLKESLGFNIPISINLVVVEYDLDKLFKLPEIEIVNNENLIDPFIYKSLRIYEEKLRNIEEKNKDYLVCYLTTYFLRYLTYQSALKKGKWNIDDYIQYLQEKECFKNSSEIFNVYIEKILHIQEKYRGIVEKFSNETLDTMQRTVKSFNEIIQLIETIDEYSLHYYGDPNRFQISYNISNISNISFNDNRILILLMNMFNGVSIASSLLSDISFVDWHGMSEGEFNLLKTFSKIFVFRNRIFSKNTVYDTLLIMIDEPDSSLHPELARRFVDYLISMTNLIFKNDNIQIQYIITTHSPFVISDIPNLNCIFLNKSIEGKMIIEKLENATFASNLISLLSNSFFMKNSIGQFASRRINDIIEIGLKNNTISSNEFELINYVINQVGDPIIQATLKDILYRGKKSDKD